MRSAMMLRWMLGVPPPMTTVGQSSTPFGHRSRSMLGACALLGY